MALRRWLGVLALGALPPSQDAAEPGGTLIVLNKSDDTAALIDPITGETRSVVPTGAGPHEVAVSPDGTLAVVANYGHRTGGNSLTLIDLVGAEPAGEIELTGYTRPHGIVFVGDSGRMLVTAETQRALIEVDLVEGSVVRAIRTDQDGSHMVAVTPDGRRAFVANIGSGTVSAIDLVAGELLANVPTGAECEGIDVTPDGKEVWASNRRANTVSILDADSLEVVAELESSAFPIRVKITPDGARALVSCGRAGEVCVYDVAARELLGKIPMAYEPVEGSERNLFGPAFAAGAMPVGILVAPAGDRAYVANTNSNLVAVLDLVALEVVGTIATGNEPDGLAWAGL